MPLIDPVSIGPLSRGMANRASESSCVTPQRTNLRSETCIAVFNSITSRYGWMKLISCQGSVGEMRFSELCAKATSYSSACRVEQQQRLASYRRNLLQHSTYSTSSQ